MSRHAGIQTPVQDRGSSPLLPSDHVLGSGAVWFPGVFDQHGCPLIIFPADGQDRLLELSKAEVVDFIHYFHALLNKKQEKQSLVSVVADLRQAAPPTTRFITETLLLLEEHKRTVHSVYIIQPKRKDVAKLLLKLLVGSKSCNASFRNILLKEIPELWNSIDRSQLPASLGGYFLYCHHSWVSFMKEIDGFVQEFLSVVQRLPSCISTLQALSRLPLPSSLSQLQHFCSTNEATFLQLRRELGLDELLKHCEAVCEKLRHPDREPCYQAMAGTPFFTQTAFDMLQNHSRITAAVEKVELLWQQAFAKAHLQLQVLQLSSNALQIVVKMESLQEKLQPYRMEMAKDSTTAALLLSEFETSISTPAMALIRCAEDVIHTLEEISPVKSWHEESWALELERQKENLHSAVQVVLQTLRAVSSCHHYYNKADRWYRLVLSDRFLPELLSGVHEEQQSNSLRTIPAWRQRLSTFLRKNPPPEMEELLHLSRLSTSIPDNEVQQASRRLSQRCMILRTLLMSSGPVSVEQLQLALQWQYEMLHGNLNSELCLNHSDEDKGSSERAHAVCESGLEAGSHPAALLSAAVVGPSSADWSAQLEASGGKDEVENFQKLTRVSDPTMAAPGQPSKQEEGNFNASGSEVDGKLGSTLPANFSSASIQIIPKVEAESLNLEIMVKRSAAPPTNPWLSLPVDDLENSYTVTITPKPTPQKKLSPECSGVGAQEGGSSQRFSHTEALSCMKLQHSCEDDPELSPISNVLCSTITDGRDTEVPTLLWDSYDLHEEKPEVDSMIDLSLTDWEVKEQENLREVERILNQAGGILEEEENVLAQEAELDALLRDGDGKDLWPQWGSNQQLHQVSTDLVDGGQQQLSQTDSMTDSDACSDAADDFCSDKRLTSRLDLLGEMRHGHVLDPLLKIQELKLSQQPSEGAASTSPHPPGLHTNREAFWLQLEKRGEEIEKTLDEAPGYEDMAPESGRCCVLDEFGEDSETGCNTADGAVGENPPLSEGLNVGDTSRVSSFCDLKESSVDVQPSIVCGKEMNEKRLTSELMPHDGEFDPGGKLLLLPVSETETASLPLNGRPAEHEKASGPAPAQPTYHPQLHLKSDAPRRVATDCRKDFLYPNVKEHINNNNNNNHVVPGNAEAVSEVTKAEKVDSSTVPAGKDEQQADLQPVLLMAPIQPLEFDPGGGEDHPDGVLSSDSDHVTQRVQTQFREDDIIQITDFNVPIVLDMGSGLMKAGFANQDLPNVTFPTITGVPKYEEIMSGAVEKELYVGHDAQHMRGVLTLNHPIKNGIICNWEEMEKMWQYTFQQLCVDPEEHPVLLTEAAMNPLENRQRMVEIMFENFGVPLAYVAMQAVLALYAAGRTTGVVVDSGEGVSHSVPVFEGYSLPHAVQRFPLAGLDVTLQLKKLLQEQGVCMRTTAEDEIVREMKEKCCCVALNYEAELNPGSSSCREMQYTMPDGQIVTMGTERFRAPEILFNPDMIGRDHPGIHESIFKSILRSDIDLRRSFLGNIILSGGNTLLPGLPERLQAEVKSLVPADMRVNVCVTSPKDRRFLVWSGGAVLANLSTFNSAWISRGDCVPRT
uniref:Si:ch211-241j12.3 n=1 Tax=Poecilia latipinna TaxID=48699 RepID=A0A3B3VUV5_9TELE